MSQPQRFDCDGGGMFASKDGEWVEWEDYAALAADRDVHIKALRDEVDCVREENAALAAEFGQLKQDYLQLRIKNGNLAAENERLNDIVNHYYHIPNADTVSYASWSKLSAEYEQVKQAGLMLADTSKAVVKQLKDQVLNLCEQRDALAAENERLRSKLSFSQSISEICKQTQEGETITVQGSISSGKTVLTNLCQCERLAAENERLNKNIAVLVDELATVSAKVEWLRKADRLVIWNGEKWVVRQQILPQ